MKILVAGSSGLVGSSLVPFLRKHGHDVVRLLRKEQGTDGIVLDPDNKEQFEGFDAVINLAGENIAGRWTKSKKERIYASRVHLTERLSGLLAGLKQPPKVLVNASAIGFYGSRGDELLTEESVEGEGFLAKVCRDWEKATEKASGAGIRVVNLRISTVLSDKGGALAQMLGPFKWGLGGVIGSGKQYMSWILLDDLVRVFLFCIEEKIQGPVNAATSFSVTNEEFTKTLGSLLRKPTVLPVPEFLVHLLFGEMGKELLLSSCRVVPQKLLEKGFVFHYPHLQPALIHLLS